tara:strand:+ start:207 stop:578 length:372 start_codon:yes stop_codon:yes gene_type:complete
MAKKVNKQVASKTPTHQEQRLPWWVEVLFVQVGLPDKWLRTFLKLKKTSQRNLKQNQKSVALTFIFLLLLAYIHPIIKKAAISNRCIKNTEDYISKTIKDGKVYKLPEITIVAHNFCNGGKLE